MLSVHMTIKCEFLKMINVNTNKNKKKKNKTHIILSKDREAEKGSQVGQSLDLSATARTQRFRTPQRERRYLNIRATITHFRETNWSKRQNVEIRGILTKLQTG